MKLVSNSFAQIDHREKFFRRIVIFWASRLADRFENFDIIDLAISCERTALYFFLDRPHMFTIKAGYSDDVEICTSVDRARDFFADLGNFADLMPGISSIHIDAKGVAHWKIEAEIPRVGPMIQKFAVELAENTLDRIEWFPVAQETQNFLRFSADFLEKAKNVTLVHFTQMVELRRRSSRELHLLAGLAGESLISSEMTKKVTEMIRVFIKKAKVRLEGSA